MHPPALFVFLLQLLAPAQPHVIAPHWQNVAACRTCPGTLAVWNPRRVERSTDEGATWQPIGGRGAIRAVTVNDDGTVIVVRDAMTFVPAAGSAWTEEAPERGDAQIAARGETVAWFGEAGLRVSRDGGHTFAATVTGPWHGNFENTVNIAGDGSVWGYAHSEAPCGGGGEMIWRVAEGATEATERSAQGLWGVSLGANGLILGVDESPLAALHLAVIAPNASAPRRVADLARGVYEVATGQRATLVHDRSTLIAVDEAGMRSVASDVPVAFELRAVDGGERAIGIRAGRVVRHEADGSWRTLH